MKKYWPYYVFVPTFLFVFTFVGYPWGPSDKAPKAERKIASYTTEDYVCGKVVDVHHIGKSTKYNRLKITFENGTGLDVRADSLSSHSSTQRRQLMTWAIQSMDTGLNFCCVEEDCHRTVRVYKSQN